MVSRPGLARIPSVDLDGTRILVAGATGAFGGALARALGDEGAQLALAGRDPQRLEVVITAVVDAVRQGGREIAWDLKARELTSA